MPRPTSAKKHKNAIRSELLRWKSRSRQMKTSSHIAFAKIKSHLHVLEETCSRSELNDLTNEIG